MNPKRIVVPMPEEFRKRVQEAIAMIRAGVPEKQIRLAHGGVVVEEALYEMERQ